MPNGHYIKILYKGPKPIDKFETQPRLELELKNTNIKGALDMLTRVQKILSGEYGQ